MDPDATPPITYRSLEEMIARGAGLPNNYYYVEKLLLGFSSRAGTRTTVSDFEATFAEFDAAFIAAAPILALLYPRDRRIVDALNALVVG